MATPIVSDKNMASERDVSSLADAAERIYEESLRKALEPCHIGKAVAIDVVSREYAVGSNHSEAACKLRTQLTQPGQIFTLTIGPLTPEDVRRASFLARSRQ